MDKAKVIDKVQKLLALSKSSNPHEAELAAQRAGEILAKYDLTMMEVLAKEKGEDMAFIQKALLDSIQTGNYKWEGILIASLSPVFDCEVIRIPATLRASSDVDAFEIFGTKHDLEMLIHFFRFLRMRIHNDVRKYHTKKEQASYASGLIRIVKERLDTMYSKKQEAMKRVDASKVKDLVIFKKDLARQALKNEHKRITKSTIKRGYDRSAYMQGERAGHKVPIGRPIEGGGAPSQIR